MDPTPPIQPPRDQVFENNYNTTLLMTNTNSGSTANDGFLLQQQNWNIRFLQREHGYMEFRTPGGNMILSATGRFGLGDTIVTHKFNVQGTARFGSAVKMVQSLTVDGTVSTGGALSVGGTLNTTGTLTVGSATSLGNLIVHGATSMEYGLTVGGSATLHGTLNAQNNASVVGTLSVNGATTLGSSLTAGGATTLNNTLTVSGATILNGTLTAAGGLYYDAQGFLKVKHLKVTLTGWPDYVFSGSHTLMPLNELEAYVGEYGHLPGVPSAQEVEEQGADLGEMNKLLVEKVEELTLYIIDLQKQINELKSNK